MGKREKETEFTLALLQEELLGWTGLGQSRTRGAVQPPWLKCCPVPRAQPKLRDCFFHQLNPTFPGHCPSHPNTSLGACFLSTALVAVTQLKMPQNYRFSGQQPLHKSPK